MKRPDIIVVGAAGIGRTVAAHMPMGVNVVIADTPLRNDLPEIETKAKAIQLTNLHWSQPLIPRKKRGSNFTPKRKKRK